jgi:hypothetical protein
MFSVRKRARLAGVALAGIMLAGSAAANAGVVVKSSGPSADQYPVGEEVADSSTISLRAGDKITVLTDRGTKVMQGPGTFRVGERPTRTRARLTNMTRRNAARGARTGAVRGSGGSSGPDTIPNLWLVDVTRGGPTCLYNLDRVRLWRPVSEEAQTYRISQVGTNEALDVEFVGTESVRALDPAGLQLMNGQSYTITGPASEGGSMPNVEIRVIEMTEAFRQPAELARALVANGCMSQVAVLGNTAEAEAS